MWISISNGKSFVDTPCERCGSKRRISKTWTETHDTFNGVKKTIECSQIICTNDECQESFDKKSVAETKKREELKQTKIKNDEIRKSNALKNRIQRSPVKV